MTPAEHIAQRALVNAEEAEARAYERAWQRVRLRLVCAAGAGAAVLLEMVTHA